VSYGEGMTQSTVVQPTGLDPEPKQTTRNVTAREVAAPPSDRGKPTGASVCSAKSRSAGIPADVQSALWQRAAFATRRSCDR
jgi:hypothetical protein